MAGISINIRHRIRILLLTCFVTIVPSLSWSQTTLTMEQAIRIAQEQSLSAMVARLNFMSHYWSYRSFKAQLLPSVSLSGNLLNFNRSMVEARNFDDGRVSYVENNTLSNSMMLSVTQNIVPLGGTLSLQSSLSRLDQFNYDNKIFNSQPIRLSYTQPLRTYNELKWQKKSEPLKLERAKRAYLEAMEGVAVEAVTRFFDVLAAQSAYQQSLATLKDRQYLFEISKKRLDLGTTTKSEHLQLELSLLNAQVDVNSSEQTLRSLKYRLISYLHLRTGDDVELIPPYLIPEIDVNAGDVLNKAMANSTHTLDQRISLIEAERQVAQAKSNKGIQMQLNGNLGFYRTSDHFTEAYKNLESNQIVGISVQIPIFDWGVAKGRVKMAQADLEATKAQLEQEHETYIYDLQNTIFQFSIQSAQCQNTKRAQEIAEERYNITKRRFETGAITVTDLNTAQQESESARAQYINQLKTFWSDFYTIRKLTLYDWVGHYNLDVDFDKLIK